jgi:dolichol-phosphate mannosyltransferase
MVTAAHRRAVYVVLSTFNEENKIERLLDRIVESLDEAGLNFKILLLDDGSTDATARIITECANRMPLLIKRHDVNKGIGATIRDGLIWAAEIADQRDIIVTMDADDSHTPGLILRMVRMLSEGCDVVIASRYQPGSRTIGAPLSRILLGYLGSLMFRILFPIPGVKDFTCGFRAYRGEVLKEAIRYYGSKLFDQEGFQSIVAILLKLRAMNLVFGEVPMILRYDLKEGASRLNVSRTIRQALTVMVNAPEVAPGKEYYDRNYHSYDLQNPSRKLAFYRELAVQGMNDRPSHRILDLGCAFGLFLSTLGPEWERYGLDINEFAIDEAARRLPNAAFQVSKAECIPFKKQFDVIAAFDVLEHIADLDTLAETVKSSLAPGGRFVFVVPVYDGINGWLVNALDKDYTHVHRESRWFWLKWASTHFRVEKWTGVYRYTLPTGYYIHLPTGALRRTSPALAIVATTKT